MLIAIAVLTLAAGDPAPPPPPPPLPPVRICSDMKAVTVEGVMFESANGGANVNVKGELKAGACAVVFDIAPGDYTLRFIETAGDHAMMCARHVTVHSSDEIHLNPEDGSSCIM